MSEKYKLITARVKEDTYQHRLFLTGLEVNIGDFSGRALDLFKNVSANSARSLEYMKAKGIQRSIHEASLSLDFLETTK